MRLYLVRHAHAGDRSAWADDDRLRPLSRKGARQATALGDALVGTGAAHLVSSPAIRCLETLRPLAERSGVMLDSDPRVAEGADPSAAWALFEELRSARRNAVVCSHGDVIPEFLWVLQANGTRFRHAPTWPKASTWVVAAGGGGWTEASYMPPPKI